MILKQNDKQLNFPDFIIVGAARSGTTALYSALNRHPQIFMPEEKEPLFFNSYGNSRKKTIAAGKVVDSWQNYSLDQYSALFDSAGEKQIRGEASVHYLYEYQRTIENIKYFYQDKAKKLKIIIILRNPADRAWSHHLLRYTNHSETLPFREAINFEIIDRRLKAKMLTVFDYIGYGLYADQVKEWQKNFPLTQVWLYEEFFSDLDRYTIELTDFLGIRPNHGLASLKRTNSSGVAENKITQFFVNRLHKPEKWKKPFKQIISQRVRQELKREVLQKLLRRQNMDPGLRQELLNNYRDDIHKLEVVLQRDLSLWLNGDNLNSNRSHM